ncbi:aldo/keto reductase [Stutzerimonas kirkiae]|uniref:Aldo/keto reductase n=1 Tax=Stutzerimonas kirkiae TaxID=2211392 RepID=A0A4Q9RBW6_9GAMM|nr:aldo/keto reductase [Stutzerimonas kirkiae]TBU98531.1 aldo/keto reductase [Stutzerimonas kirkiae]TBV04294.1 aldo/keto reductase [Stutzerimonas kirkiae]TBV10998.1 aldo/keto reductase [Stutzerimonas kirkiae]TBV14357.1 aldo/keto reductase [Stutzerimonas kirkiae]
MSTRRDFVSGLALSAAGLALATPLRFAVAAGGALPAAGALQARAIPSSGERLPVIGMGSSGSFEVGSDAAARDPLREVLRRFFAAGATLIDTAPGYGPAEGVIGDLLEELGLRQQTFLATKIGASGREAGLAQFERSLRLLKTDKVELLQVHSLQDWRTQYPLIEELKAQGKTRYTGLTHFVDSGHDELAEVVRAVKPDFLQVNYSVISRNAEARVFPLAQELGVAVLVNRAFEDGKLFARVQGKTLPSWAAEAGIGSWAQAFLKFALSHPAVTAVIPATGRPERQSDQLLAGHGPTLSQAQRQSLIELFG